jgi:hypothetical protein
VYARNEVHAVLPEARDVERTVGRQVEEERRRHGAS